MQLLVPFNGLILGDEGILKADEVKIKSKQEMTLKHQKQLTVSPLTFKTCPLN